MGFDLSGFSGLESALEEQAHLMERMAGSGTAKSSLKKALDVIVMDARARVHSITGNLSRGIQSRVTVRVDSPIVGEASVSYARSPKAHHAHLVEGGHKGPHGPAAPHPFWEPAVEATGEEAVQALADAVNDFIDTYWK